MLLVLRTTSNTGQGKCSARQEEPISHFKWYKKGPILGKQACVKPGLIARVDEIGQPTIQTSDQQKANDMVSTYKDVFSGLGLIRSNAIIHIDKNLTLCYS